MNSALSSMVVLGNHATKPHLRLWRFPDCEPLDQIVATRDSSGAFDVVVRDSWLALPEGGRVYGVALPFGQRAFSIGNWFDCVPAPTPTNVFLGRPVEPPSSDRGGRPTIVTEYDGVQREVMRTVEFRPGLEHLIGATGDALVFTPWCGPDRGGRAVRVMIDSGVEEDLGPAGLGVTARHGSTVAIPNGKATRALDLVTGEEEVYVPPAGMEWRMPYGAFSPDGVWFARSVNSVDDRYGPGRLALYRRGTGESLLVDGHATSYMAGPVWSNDSSWCLCDAPNDKSMYACSVSQWPPRLEPLPMKRQGRPRLYLDVSHLLQPGGSSK